MPPTNTRHLTAYYEDHTASPMNFIIYSERIYFNHYDTGSQFSQSTTVHQSDKSAEGNFWIFLTKMC